MQRVGDFVGLHYEYKIVVAYSYSVIGRHHVLETATIDQELSTSNSIDIHIYVRTAKQPSIITRSPHAVFPKSTPSTHTKLLLLLVKYLVVELRMAKVRVPPALYNYDSSCLHHGICVIDRLVVLCLSTLSRTVSSTLVSVRVLLEEEQ